MNRTLLCSHSLTFFILFITFLTLLLHPAYVTAKCASIDCSGHGTCVWTILNISSSSSIVIEPTDQLNDASSWCQCATDWRGDMITSDCIVHTPDLLPLYIALCLPSLYNLWIAQSRLRGAIAMWRQLQRSTAHASGAANTSSYSSSLSLWRQPMFRFAVGSILNSLLMMTLYMMVGVGGYVPVRDWPPTIIMAITQTHFCLNRSDYIYYLLHNLTTIVRVTGTDVNTTEILTKVMRVLKFLSPLILIPFFILVAPALTHATNDDAITNNIIRHHNDNDNTLRLNVLRIWLIVIALLPVLLAPQAQYYSHQLVAIIEKGIDNLPDAARLQRQQSAKNIRAVLLPATIGPILYFIALFLTALIPQLLQRHTYLMAIYTFLNHVGTGGIVRQLNPNINMIAGTNRIQVGNSGVAGANGSSAFPPHNPMLRSYTSRNLFAQQHLFHPSSANLNAATNTNGENKQPGIGLPKDSSSGGFGAHFNVNGGIGSFRRSHSAMHFTQPSPRHASIGSGSGGDGPKPLHHVRYPSDGLGSMRGASQRYMITSVATSPVAPGSVPPITTPVIIT